MPRDYQETEPTINKVPIQLVPTLVYQCRDPGGQWQDAGTICANPPAIPGREYRLARDGVAEVEWDARLRTWHKADGRVKPIRDVISELIVGARKGEWCPTAAQEKLLTTAQQWAAVPASLAAQFRAMYKVAYGVTP
jgi:hypothetical protein